MPFHTQPRLLTRSIVTITAIALLTACRSVPVTPVAPGMIRVDYSQTYMDGSKLKEIPTEVMIVKRSDTVSNVAAQIGITAVTLLFGGVGIGGQGFSKDGLKGAPIDDIGDRNNIRNPVADTFVTELQNKINQHVQEHSTYKNTEFRQPILVSGGRAALVYETLGNDEEKFRLKTDLLIYKAKERRSYFSPNPYLKVDCQNASSEPLSREAWAEADYRLVKTELDAMLATCEKKVLASLPELLQP